MRQEMIEVNYHVEDVVQAYLGNLKRRKAPLTVVKYQPFLELFALWAGSRSLASVTAVQIEDDFLAGWFEEFEQRYGRPPSDNTQRNCQQAIRSFYAYAERFDYLVDADGHAIRNPTAKLEKVKVRKRIRDWLRADELDALMAATYKSNEKILVAFFAWTGARMTEGTSVWWRDVDFVADTITLGRLTKTDNGIRTIPLLPELRPILRAWEVEQRAKGLVLPDGPVLATRNGTAMKQQQVDLILRRVGKRAGLTKTVGAQMLRRTYGSLLLNSGVTIHTLAKLMGHASSRTTEESYA